MNLMFWKKKTTAEDAHGETAELRPAPSKRRLVIGAAGGVLVLAATGWTTWKIFLPSPTQTAATTDTPTLIQSTPLPEKPLIRSPATEFIRLRKTQSKDHQTDIEALKKKNYELQAQLEMLEIEPSQAENPRSLSREAETKILKNNNDALRTQIEVLKAELPKIEKAQSVQHQVDIDAIAKKNDELQAQIEVLKSYQQPRPSASPANQAPGKARPPSLSGDIAVGNKNPKATAIALKEAIDAMNADSATPTAKIAK